MTYLLFVGFYNLFFFIGRGFYSLLLSNNFLKNKKIFNLDLNLLFPLIGLYIIGNVTFITNFFHEISTETTVVTILFFVSLNLLSVKIFVDKKILIYNLVIPLILSISSNSALLHSDSGFYHLQYQNWLRNYKIVKNLVLPHSKNGYSSIYDYISSNFWLSENYLLLHFVSLVFITSFFSILMFYILFQNNLFLRYSSLIIVVYSFLDNFGYAGGRNGFIYIQGIGKQDVAYAIVFYLVFLFSIFSIKYDKYTIENLFWITSFSLFAIQLRITGIFLTPILLVYFYKILQNLNAKYVLKYTFLQTTIGFFWIIKNLIISGCIFFPISFTCFDRLNSFGREMADTERSRLLSYHKGFKFNEDIVEWFYTFINFSINKQIFINFLISFIICKFFLKIFFTVEKSDNKILQLFIIATILVNFISLIFSGPADRFFIPIFLTTIGIVNFVNIKDLNYRNNFYKKTLPFVSLIIVCFSVLLTPKLSDYLDIKKGLQTIKISTENIEYKKIENSWGTKPINSKNCFEKIDCVYERIELIFNEKKLRFEVKN